MELIQIEKIAHLRNGIPAYQNISEGEEVIHYKMSNYNREKDMFNDGTKAFITSSQVQKHLLCNNDLLLSIKGAKYYCALYNPEYEEKAIASDSLLVLQVTDARIMPEYLCWLLNRPETGKELMISSSNHYIIRKEKVASLGIPLVSLEAQALIIEICKLQKEKIKIQKEQILLYEEIQSYFFSILHR
jgi:restriction endonuclease, S subunit